MDSINFNEQYKIRIADSDDSMRLHEIVKLIIVCELMKRTKMQKKYHGIYTEHPVGKNGKARRFDVYHKNLKTKEITVYEVQKDFSGKWEEKLTKFIRETPIDLNCQIIDLNKLPESLSDVNKWVVEQLII